MQTQTNRQNVQHPQNGQNGRLTPTRENYLRTLFQLSRSSDGVRLTDLAKAEGVRLPTARHAVNCLRELGLAAQENYGRIQLTEAGRKMGREICNRFDLTRKFLIEVLGVPEANAENEACVMEHHLHDDTLERIAAFVKHVSQCTNGKLNGDSAAVCIVNLRHEMEETREALAG